MADADEHFKGFDVRALERELSSAVQDEEMRLAVRVFGVCVWLVFLVLAVVLSFPSEALGTRSQAADVCRFVMAFVCTRVCVCLCLTFTSGR